jgi:hypothetical protein
MGMIWLEDAENDLQELKVNRWRHVTERTGICSAGGQDPQRAADPK